MTLEFISISNIFILLAEVRFSWKPVQHTLTFHAHRRCLESIKVMFPYVCSASECRAAQHSFEA